MGRKKNSEKRSLIWHTAYDLFTTQGYKNITVNEVASATGISSNLVPHYFKKNDDFLVNIYECFLRSAEAFTWPLAEADAEVRDFIKNHTHCTRTLLSYMSWRFILQILLKDDEKLLNLYGEIFFNMELSIRTIRRLYAQKSKTMINLYQKELVTPISIPENGETFLFQAFASVWTIHYRDIAKHNYKSTMDYKDEILSNSLESFAKALEIPSEHKKKIKELSKKISTQKRFEEYCLYYDKIIDEFLSKDQRAISIIDGQS